MLFFRGQMNIIFLTLINISTVEERGIYTDLMRKFRDEGHKVFIVSPFERRLGKKTHLTRSGDVSILNVRTLNIQKTNIFEKGVGTLLIESQYQSAIKKNFSGISFDLILYSTPPITFTNVVSFLKRHNPKAVSYLLLKDIFPQNAIDIGLFGEKSLFKWYFRRKEIKLYKVSDYIGCMSPANVEFIRKHNAYYPSERVEVAPNSIEVSEDNTAKQTVRESICCKYGLPKNLPILIYGGNLGKPQGVDYLIKCLEANSRRNDCMFLVVGNGTEYQKLAIWYERQIANPQQHFNVKLMERLPKEDYDMLVRSCDVGLIFLDHRFTIPNYPSRLLSYLEYKMPVICATDPNTDIGRIAEDNGYGYWCESVRPDDFTALVNKMLKSDLKAMGECGYEFLKKHYLVEHTYKTIMAHV